MSEPEPLSHAPAAVSKDDLAACGWRALVEAAPKREHLYYASAFLKAAQHATNLPERAALELLGNACCLSVSKLYLGLNGLGPAHLLATFTDPQLDALFAFAKTEIDPELRARIADLVWTRHRERSAAEMAVDAYLYSAKMLEDHKEWVPPFDRIERAVQLAAKLGKKNALFMRTIACVEDTIGRLDSAAGSFYPEKLMQLLLEHREGNPKTYAAKAVALARAASAARDRWLAIALHELAARWLDRDEDAEGARAQRTAGAEAFVNMAHDAARANDFLQAAAHVQSAIAAYRKLGRSRNRVESLLRAMEDYQRRTVDQFKRFGSTVDLSETVTVAVEAVRGKATLREALFAFVALIRPPSVESLRNAVKSLAEASPLRFMMPRAVVDPDTGRTLGVRNGLSPSGPDQEFEDAMFEHAAFLQHLTAAALEPARRLISEEHEIRDYDLVPLIWSSPFVPQGHELRIARGLVAGLRGDFLAAGAFLITQLENCVRYTLETEGVAVHGLDREGLQDVHHLDHLLSSPEATRTFGEENVFEMRGILIERFGSNLRNRDAHGLLRDEAYTSTHGIYLWLMALRLCLWPLLVAELRAAHGQGTAGGASDLVDSGTTAEKERGPG
jgi:hypothetical protein